MKKILLVLLLVLVASLLALVVYSYRLSAPLFDEKLAARDPEIAPPALALSFARTAEALLLVESMDATAVTGRDLTAALGESRTADLPALYHSLGYDALAQLEAPRRKVALDQLVPPLDYTYPHVAAGTNFKEHAEEVYVDDPPFLFPKLAGHTGWSAPVPFTERLDYEAELCMFPLSDITAPEQQVEYGLVLCNDFTDRWTLLKELDLDQPLGITGFAAGKGCANCLPTGYLVLIPRQATFYRELEVELFVNDRLRQRFSMSGMILPIEAIVEQAFALDATPFARGEDSVDLLPQGIIPRGTLLLTGTAAGVIFKPLNIWNQGFYLQAGDVVRTRARYLGHLENRIDPAP